MVRPLIFSIFAFLKFFMMIFENTWHSYNTYLKNCICFPCNSQSEGKNIYSSNMFSMIDTKLGKSAMKMTACQYNGDDCSWPGKFNTSLLTKSLN